VSATESKQEECSVDVREFNGLEYSQCSDVSSATIDAIKIDYFAETAGMR
jgi:hypothetical protein